MRAVKNMDTDNNEIAEKENYQMNWDNKKVIGRERNEETIHSIKDNKHINSFFYNLPDIWLLKSLHRNTCP